MKNCNETITFLEELNRMCNSYMECCDCPIYNFRCSCCIGKGVGIESKSEKMIEIIQKWSDEHPERYLTRKDKEFLDGFRFCSDDKKIGRSNLGNLFFKDKIHDSSYSTPINPEMFDSILYGETFSFKELKEWEVK